MIHILVLQLDQHFVEVQPLLVPLRRSHRKRAAQNLAGRICMRSPGPSGRVPCSPRAATCQSGWAARESLRRVPRPRTVYVRAYEHEPGAPDHPFRVAVPARRGSTPPGNGDVWARRPPPPYLLPAERRATRPCARRPFCVGAENNYAGCAPAGRPLGRAGWWD